MKSAHHTGEQLLYLYGRYFPIQRGKVRTINALWNRAVPSTEAIRWARLRHGGFRLQCDLREMLQRQFYFFGTYLTERHILECWTRLAYGAEMVFDVGANAGIYGLAALGSSPNATVHAFEPTPEIASRLRNTIAINNLTRLHVHELAIAAKTGCVYLNVWRGEHDDNEGMNFVTATATSAAGTSVKSVSLDNFCAEHGIGNIDLLKIDVQGNEAFVLEGANQLLRKGRVGTIFIELNWSPEGPANCPATRCISCLNEYGFRFAKPTRRLQFEKPGDWLESLSEVIAGRF